MSRFLASNSRIRYHDRAGNRRAVRSRSQLKTLLALLLLAAPANPRAMNSVHQTGQSALMEPFLTATDTSLVCWPVIYGLQHTGTLNHGFDCFGDIGSASSSGPRPSFETPPGSGIQYLYWGGIWVGGIVGSDTLVSEACPLREMYPTGYPYGNGSGLIMPFEYPTLLSMRAGFDDTIHTGITYAESDVGKPYTPLHVAVANRSHSFSGPHASDCIIYDVTLTNIGTKQIQKGYFGIYMDADIYNPRSVPNGYGDDLAGSVPDHGIAYMVDNDGDPVAGNFVPESSPTKTIAIKFLNTSFTPLDTNFKWWARVSTANGYFGPQLRSQEGKFGATGYEGTGHDAVKYSLMSTPEWDYDQVISGTIGANDPKWLYPDQAVAQYVKVGADTRFLFSIGPFDMLPDSSVRLQFAVFTADSVHIDPHIMDFIKNAPELYASDLNMTNLIKNAAVADSLGDLLLNPMLSPMRLQVIGQSDDTAVVTWDPWVLQSIEGSNVYLSEIPDSAYPHPGVIPPWFRPDSLKPAGRVDGQATRFTMRGLIPSHGYVCNVTHRTVGGEGAPSDQLLFAIGRLRDTVRIVDTTIILRPADTMYLRWTAAGMSGIDHFNIYKFADTAAARLRFTAHYATCPHLTPPADSFVTPAGTYYYYAMPVQARIPGSEFVYSDFGAADGNAYIITAVDSFGFESPFSDIAVTYRVPARTDDILVLFNSGNLLSYIVVDSARTFYESILDGYRYDLYSFVDSINAPGCSFPWTCFDWRSFMRYRLLIVDDGLRDAIITTSMENRSGGFAKYIHAGGTLAYFGSFSDFGGVRLDPRTLPSTRHVDSMDIGPYFGLDSIFYVGSWYYRDHSTPPYVDSLFGFAQAEAAIKWAPNISFDQSRYPFDTSMLSLWPTTTPPSVSTFRPSANAQVTHRYRSLVPATSMNENQPVGIVSSISNGTSYLFGFHLWYMERGGARELLDWMLSQIPTAVTDQRRETLPDHVALYQNFPNPFNPTTQIRFALPSQSRVTLEIFNILGQRVKLLVDGTLSAGEHTISWNAAGCGSGVYLYRLRAGSHTEVRKMLLLK